MGCGSSRDESHEATFERSEPLLDFDCKARIYVQQARFLVDILIQMSKPLPSIRCAMTAFGIPGEASNRWNYGAPKSPPSYVCMSESVFRPPTVRLPTIHEHTFLFDDNTLSLHERPDF